MLVDYGHLTQIDYQETNTRGNSGTVPSHLLKQRNHRNEHCLQPKPAACQSMKGDHFTSSHPPIKEEDEPFTKIK